VLRTDGRCVMLISQELVPVILGVIQSPETVETKDTCSDETHLQRKQDPHNPTISEHVAVAQRLTANTEYFEFHN
ncbi:hypothetical protein RRG08_053160, partial [Elysia crispata]